MKLLKAINKLTKTLESEAESKEFYLGLVPKLTDILNFTEDVLDQLKEQNEYCRTLGEELADLRKKIFCDDNYGSGTKVHCTVDNKNYIVIHIAAEDNVICMDPSSENMRKDAAIVEYASKNKADLEDGWRSDAANAIQQ